jgi:hypothetical protein
MTSMPPAWADLLEALTLLAQHPADTVSPFNCTHDTLYVLADDSAFTDDEIARLEALGFNRNSSDGGFYSFRYGSA